MDLNKVLATRHMLARTVDKENKYIDTNKLSSILQLCWSYNLLLIRLCSFEQVNISLPFLRVLVGKLTPFLLFSISLFLILQLKPRLLTPHLGVVWKGFFGVTVALQRFLSSFQGRMLCLGVSLCQLLVDGGGESQL